MKQCHEFCLRRGECTPINSRTDLHSSFSLKLLTKRVGNELAVRLIEHIKVSKLQCKRVNDKTKEFKKVLLFFNLPLHVLNAIETGHLTNMFYMY